jgi:DNA (cytosine-5)-methyltransferase 3A
MKPINVVSLFNGMSTGHTALDNLNIPIGNYYSSEIKPHAIELTQFHYPNTIQVGDVNNWKEWDIDWKSIDLVLSGSPCKDLSIAGKRKGINGSNSGLFWKFIEILNHIKSLNPNVLFFQENVGSAPKEDIGIMSRALGVYPVRFNSSLVTAQLRDRYYWSNFKVTEFGMFGDLVTDIPAPKDRNIKLIDIITDGWTDKEKANCILESESRMTTSQESLKKRYVKDFNAIVYLVDDEVRVKTNTVKGYDVLTENDCLNLSFPSSTTRRGRVTKGKAPCLLAGNEPLYILKDLQVRMLNKIELCRLQGFQDNHLDILSRNKAASLIGDGWTLPMVEHFFKYIPEAMNLVNKNKPLKSNELVKA